MIKCKQAIENPTSCGKSCCCFDCEERATCKDVCSQASAEGCPDAIVEGAELAVFQSAVLTITQTIANIATEKKKLDAEDEKMRKELKEAMEQYGFTSFENEYVKITYVEPSTKTSVDSKKLKKDLPDIYEKYSKTSDVTGYVKISVKQD